MTLAPNFLIAGLALALAPASTLAQTWPGIAVAGAPALAQSRPATKTLTPSRPRVGHSAKPLAIRSRKVELARTAPAFELRAKPEWSDDEGFRISRTRLAFKSRF